MYNNTRTIQNYHSQMSYITTIPNTKFLSTILRIQLTSSLSLPRNQ